MSVEPWMVAWPRSARMPPPGRPMLPSSSCRTLAARDHLRADRVLRPARRRSRWRPSSRGPSSRASASATARNCLRRAAADVGDHLRRVPRVVAFQHLEDAVRILERRDRVGASIGTSDSAAVLTCAAAWPPPCCASPACAEGIDSAGASACGGSRAVLPACVSYCRVSGSSPRRRRRDPRCPGSRRDSVRGVRVVRPRTP